jgi:lipopolysaccharide export system permease protein
MSLLDRYIFRQLLSVFSLTAVAITLMVWLIQSLRFLDWVMNRGLSLLDFLKVVFFLLPNLLLVVLPFSFLVAVILVWQRLIGDSEMAVMQGCGLSPRQIVRPALFLGGCLAVLGLFLSVWAIPKTYHAFKNAQHQIRSQFATASVEAGVFHPLEDGLTLYIGLRRGDGIFEQVMLYDERNPDKTSVISARYGQLLEDKANTYILLKNGIRHEYQDKRKTNNWLSFAEYSYSLDNKGLYTPRSNLAREEMMIGELWEKGDYTQVLSRLLTPLMALVMAVKAGAIMLRHPLGRRNQWGRSGLAFVAAFSLQLVFLLTVQLEGLSLGVLFFPLLLLLLPTGMSWRYLAHKKL